MKPILMLFVFSTLAFGASGSVSAQSDAVAERINLMRSNGMLMRSAMRATGNDAAVAAQTLIDNFAALPALFEDSATPGDTLPAAWDNGETFIALFEQAEEQSAVALAAAQAGDTGAYSAALQAVNQTCSSCHRQFRR